MWIIAKHVFLLFMRSSKDILPRVEVFAQWIVCLIRFYPFPRINHHSCFRFSFQYYFLSFVFSSRGSSYVRISFTLWLIAWTLLYLCSRQSLAERVPLQTQPRFSQNYVFSSRSVRWGARVTCSLNEALKFHIDNIHIDNIRFLLMKHCARDS